MNIAQVISAILMLAFAAAGAYVSIQFFSVAIAVIWVVMMLVTWGVVQYLAGGGIGSSSSGGGRQRQSKGARQGRD